jgi:hypothetical protein
VKPKAWIAGFTIRTSLRCCISMAGLGKVLFSESRDVRWRWSKWNRYARLCWYGPYGSLWMFIPSTYMLWWVFHTQLCWNYYNGKCWLLMRVNRHKPSPIVAFWGYHRPLSCLGWCTWRPVFRRISTGWLLFAWLHSVGYCFTGGRVTVTRSLGFGTFLWLKRLDGAKSEDSRLTRALPSEMLEAFPRCKVCDSGNCGGLTPSCFASSSILFWAFWLGVPHAGRQWLDQQVQALDNPMTLGRCFWEKLRWCFLYNYDIDWHSMMSHIVASNVGNVV